MSTDDGIEKWLRRDEHSEFKEGLKILNKFCLQFSYCMHKTNIWLNIYLSKNTSNKLTLKI